MTQPPSEQRRQPLPERQPKPGSEDPEAPAKTTAIIDNPSYRRADRVVTLSHGVARLLNERGLEPWRVRTIYNWADETQITAVLDFAYTLARSRRGRVVSVDKANVMQTSRLWRQVATEYAGRVDRQTIEMFEAHLEAKASEQAMVET